MGDPVELAAVALAGVASAMSWLGFRSRRGQPVGVEALVVAAGAGLYLGRSGDHHIRRVKDRSSLRLLPDTASVRRARDAVRDIAAEVGLTSAMSDVLMLITSELVTNGVSATTVVVEVRFAIDDTLARVEVEDDGPGHPELKEGSEHGGFGLRLVDSLATRWGWSQQGDAKTVWAEIDVAVTGQSDSIVA